MALTKPRIVDFATLKAAVASTLNRDNLDGVMPGWIQGAEAMFSREIRYRSMLRRDTTTANEEYENLPADFLELKSIKFLTTPIVTPRYLTEGGMDRYVAAHPGLTGTPKHYTIVGAQLRFDRVPGSVPLQIVSYVDIPALSDAQTTNFLLLDAPDVYEYGTLMMAEIYFKNDQRLATWTALYQTARDTLHRADKKAEQNPGPLQRSHGRVF